jgi:hypothetical protein
MLAAAFFIMLKTLWLNDPHCSLRQAPLDQWIAIGIGYLLFNSAFTRKSP